MIILMPYLCLGNIRLSTFSVVAMVSFFSCIITFVRSPKYSIWHYRRITAAILFAMFFAVMFGKLLYAISSASVDTRSFFERLVYGGCVFYGGLIGGVIGIILYGFFFRTNVLDILDVFASLLPLGQAIGRLGCFLNGCCYGIEYYGFFSIRTNVNGIDMCVFPIWFIESVFCFSLFVFFYHSKKNSRGYYTTRYLISYGLARYFIEFLRGDALRGKWGWLSTSQIISLILILCGVVFMKKVNDQKDKNEIIVCGGQTNASK